MSELVINTQKQRHEKFGFFPILHSCASILMFFNNNILQIIFSRQFFQCVCFYITYITELSKTF